MGLLDDGASWLLAQSQGCAGSPATHVRGSTRTAVTVVRKSRGERVADEAGIPFVVRQHSLVVKAGDMPGEPRAGDRFEETINGVLVTWETLPADPGSPCWAWWDRAQTAYEIDVVQVGT